MVTESALSVVNTTMNTLRYPLASCLTYLLLTHTPSALFAAPASALTPEKSALLSEAHPLWKVRAQAWYMGSDKALKRAQMREVSRTLKRGCFDCHNRGFKGYNADYNITLQMMAVSAEHNLLCSDCHKGKRGLSQLGVKRF